LINWNGDKLAKRQKISFDMREGLCFGCGQNNQIGLKLDFKWDGKTARAEFTPTELYQGWPGIVHGGITTSLLDEAMGWATRLSCFNAVTARIRANFKRPIPVGERLIISAFITKNEGRHIESKAEVSLPDGTVMAEGTSTYVVIETMSAEANSKEVKSRSDVKKQA
jgi:acyl-coenzyme A thioesterase PaaI-like protein